MSGHAPGLPKLWDWVVILGTLYENDEVAAGQVGQVLGWFGPAYGHPPTLIVTARVGDGVLLEEDETDAGMVFWPGEYARVKSWRPATPEEIARTQLVTLGAEDAL